MSRTTFATRALRATACVAAAALTAAPLVLASSSPAGAATPVLRAASIANYSGLLENSASHTLYLLSAEKGGKLKCTSSSCLKIWHPLEVKSSAKSISVQSSVKGKIGFVKRSSSEKQVTFNSYPLYTYVGDTGPNQSNGEAIAADGGTWFLVHASAKSATTSAYEPLLNAASIPSYKGILEATNAHSLYVLSVEKGDVLVCTGGCLSVWIPVYVTSTTTSIAVGAGVKGTIGFVKRTSSEYQVTFNSYPVYTYTGDTGPNQSTGENIPDAGGTWTLAAAGATSASATPVPPASSGGGGGGWIRSAR
jgi:predicted lipoprotein with Yx(FWY)xxD motif